MTTLVVITDVPSLGLTVADIVTDDPNVAASSGRARLKSSAYVAGLYTGNLRRCFVAQDPTTGAPVVPTPVDLFVASAAQSITNTAPSLGLTPNQILSLIQTYLSAGSGSSGALTGQITGTGSLAGSISQSGGSAALTGAIPGQAALSGSLTTQAPGLTALTGSVPGAGSLSGSLTTQAPGTAALSGSVPGAGTLTGTLSTSAASPMADFSNPANSQYAAALAA